MGDLAELRGLITVIAFFSCFVILVGLIPTSFLYASPGYREVTVPPYFEGLDITSYAQTYNNTVPAIYGTVHWSLGGYDWILSDPDGNSIGIGKKEYFWVFWTSTTWFECRSSGGIERGTVIDSSELDADFEGSNVKYLCHSESWPTIKFDLVFGFNTTKWDVPSEAFSNGELYFLQGIGIEAISTTISAWNLVGMLLFFQMPEIHPAINALIAIPIWVCIGYLIYVLILKAIPFVGG